MTDHADPAALLAAALAYAARGWPVFPCQPGRKEPLTAHGFKDAATDPERIRAWWQQHPTANVAIATGAPGPDVLDIDTGPGGNGYDVLAELEQTGLLNGNGMLVQTRSGGVHVYYLGTSQRNGSIRGRAADFRSAGGYVIAAPSYVEADGKPAGRYELLGDHEPSAELDWRIVRDLLDPPPPPPAFGQPHAELAGGGNRIRAGDDYAARTGWAAILQPAGWQLARDLGNGVRYWQRPGKTGRGISASTRDDGGLYVFSTSTEFDPEVPYTKFGAYAVLGHGGDHRAAAAELRRAGYGEQPPAITAGQAAAPAPAPASQPGGDPAATEARERSSWYPRNLEPILDGDTGADPPPAYLARTDGQHLIYTGKVNAFIGESESGKTWAALVACAQALTAGIQVLFLDFEDAPPGILARLQLLGVTREQITGLFRYIAPDERLTAPAAADLSEVLAGPVPGLIIVDGVNAAMTLLGLNLKDNKDVTEFSQQILRPLKRTGAAVLTVDHVTKDKENRGSYAIGAQAKRADIDGAAYIVEAVKKFGRGQQGKLKLTVSKDRPGHVRAISADAKHAGTLTLTSHPGGSITAEIEPPDMRPAADRPPWRPTHIMQRVSLVAEAAGEPMSKRAFREAVRSRGVHADLAVDRLTTDGYFTLSDGKYTSARPYREATDPENPDRATVSGTRPDASGDTARGDRVPVSDRVPRGGYYVPPGTRDTGHTPGTAAGLPASGGPPPLCTRCGEYHHRHGPTGRPCFTQPADAA